MREFLRVTIPVFAAGALAFWWAGRRVSSDVRRARWIKFGTYVVIVHAFLAAALAGRAGVVALITVIVAAGLVEMVRACRRVRRELAVTIVIAFAAIACGAVAFCLTTAPLRVACVYLVVAAFDGFSQAGGQLAGTRRLAPTVSPGKTVEGFVIGMAGAALCALLLRGAMSASTAAAIVLAAVASFAGVAGDLAASWVKRRAGLKDYGSVLAGHGGVLDRFDSFLAVAAVLFLVHLVRTT